MSEVKRYWMDDQNDADFPYECTDGDWVKYEDYARLKADVERLTKELKDEKSANTNVEGRMQSANRCLSMANHTLKAEVERLRASSFVTAVPVEQYERVVKAGDAMSEELIGRYFGNRLVTDWNAAKEGKPSV